MRAGVVEEMGPTDSVLADPQAAYTRQLIDAIPGPGWKPRRRLAEPPSARGVA